MDLDEVPLKGLAPAQLRRLQNVTGHVAARAYQARVFRALRLCVTLKRRPRNLPPRIDVPPFQKQRARLSTFIWFPGSHKTLCTVWLEYPKAAWRFANLMHFLDRFGLNPPTAETARNLRALSLCRNSNNSIELLQHEHNDSNNTTLRRSNPLLENDLTATGNPIKSMVRIQLLRDNITDLYWTTCTCVCVLFRRIWYEIIIEYSENTAFKWIHTNTHPNFLSCSVRWGLLEFHPITTNVNFVHLPLA